MHIQECKYKKIIIPEKLAFQTLELSLQQILVDLYQLFDAVGSFLLLTCIIIDDYLTSSNFDSINIRRPNYKVSFKLSDHV